MAVSAEAAPAAQSGVIRPGLLLLAALGLVVIPLSIIFWLMRYPASDPTPSVAFAHLVIVTNVSFLALIVAVLVARSALEQRAFRVLFLALGFLSMAGFFSVHALATPDVLLPSGGLTVVGGTYRQQHGAASVLGISAFLSLLIPALFFAARYLPLSWKAAATVAGRPRMLVLLLAALLVLYAALGLGLPDVLANLPLLNSPYPYLAASVTIALLLFSAWQQGREYLVSRHPMQAALAAAFLLLADAQVAMVVTAVWSLAWWGYHVLMLTAVVSALWALFVELDRRRGFERFVSPAVIERIMSGDALRLGGERRTVTILFADLRGSTALADKLPADKLVAVLNSYVGAMADCVFECGGLLDKYLGDGLMAIYGILPDPSHGAAPALRTALAIRRAVRQINDERAARNEPTVGFGVGMHTGEVVLGAVGVPRRSDYTAIGDTVNTASRLESLCKEYHVDSVVSADAVKMLDRDAWNLRHLGATPIRGKVNPVDVFTIGEDASQRT
ncbi:MAG: adenylate/guanylate cyclase domain-containing protein [Chloroflexota bacterium]|nr:adenylate/guanylate cyclase domain-containing protein [Chloroflexota bacterium]